MLSNEDLIRIKLFPYILYIIYKKKINLFESLHFYFQVLIDRGP